MKKTELRKIIKECVINILNEIEEFDPETGLSSYSPRDRTEPSLSSQQQITIPGFPLYKIGYVTFDGQNKVVVYGDDSSTSLILGMGDNQGEAVRNAIKNAKTIEQGGVGVVNENNEKTKKLADQGKKYIQLAKKIAKEEFGV